jgi:hypothetical protein
MPGPPVTIDAEVVLVPGATLVPDLGVIAEIFPPFITADGKRLATIGSLCEMTNTLTGITYPLIIEPLASLGVQVSGRALVRVGDRIPIRTPSGILTILGPPAVLFVNDLWPP